MHQRIRNASLAERLMTAEEAACLIKPGMTVAMSGFTGAGYPKAVPQALAALMERENDAGSDFRIKVLTGASTAPELDGVLAKAKGMELRLPFQSDPALRDQINAGDLDYIDIHLGHVAQHTWFGFFGAIDIAVVEVAGILEDGRLIPSSSVGNNKTWLEQADKVILEVNRWQPEELEGMHDVYYGTALPPHRKPIMLTEPDDRIGVPYLSVDQEKVVAVVETDAPDRNSPFKAPDETSQQIAGHILDFFEHEIKRGRMPEKLLPLQSGVGNVANAVLAGLATGGYEGLTAYTEVIQDGMLDLLKTGVLRMASATSFSLSAAGIEEFKSNIGFYRDRILLRPQEISNHPETIRRLGCIALNGMIESDIYGNVNSTHIAGTKMMNGIGGSGDFARNSYLSVFMSPSVAKGGQISGIVPMVSHVDHTEHDTMVVVTEQGLADMRGLSPKQRARLVIEKCAHPDYRPLLEDYFERACRDSFGKHTPHLLGEALSWHERFVETGSMRPAL
ncbi:acetyl-CoA hydrolase/transferase family protein [Arthrobacter sp. VKM Ac-2550]|uniref:acetyl-CoA hydrolase/transferase family protein n=1 Tax=Crystallibacter permensis TaxID=1938888 RepID=UPI0022261C8B|nr:acetyl-CoA hydrolase/transferase family protein [Arthrobacter sp. VKM Ac-2550]MCW2134584.1 succinyl-CoA:acetate CoA-transferase [Arthrobacter sp. VKM Ac-2550]